MSALFVHYAIEPARLQAAVPYALDLREGRAYVSLVAFTQQRLRLVLGRGPTGAFAIPLPSHGFLNVRTYVRHGAERGIFFLAEWVPQRVALWLGPRCFGLPYRLGRLHYDHRLAAGQLRGRVQAAAGEVRYRVAVDPPAAYARCPAGSLDEFLLERYVAFTEWRGRRRLFRVSHPPWPQRRVPVTIEDDGLLRAAWPWWRDARLVAANYSPGVRAVRISLPSRVDR